MQVKLDEYGILAKYKYVLKQLELNRVNRFWLFL